MIFALVAASVLGTVARAAGPVVSLQNGDVEGVVEDSVAVWRGIPFAAPPVADNRWRPPQPVQAWRPHVLKATINRPKCPQVLAFGIYGPKVSSNSAEDCLYLNVWAPHPLPKTPATVMAWIYGGAFVGGSAIDPLYDGAQLANFSREHIVVTFGYRLGVLGFAASDMLRSRDPDRSTGNYGIQDQRQALQWIQDNIVAFGGDASRVFLFGESAGANSVSNHLVRPKSWGLFHAAAMESGAFYPWPFDPRLGKEAQPGQGTVADQNPAFLSMMRDLGCSTVKCLIERPVSDIIQSQMRIFWLPVVDGVDLPEASAILASQGKLAPVPIIAGSNEEDASVGIEPNCEPATCTEANFRKWAIDSFGADGAVLYGMTAASIDRLVALYSNETSRSSTFAATKWYWAEVRAGADQFMGCPARRVAGWVTKAGHSAYWYRFTATSKSLVQDGMENVSGDFFKNACHGCEMPYVFGNRLSRDEKKLSRMIQKYWTSFASKGVPHGAVEWPLYSREDESALVLGDDVHVERRELHDKCEFWDGYFSKDWHSVSPAFTVLYS
eukprot:TRINITY_DN4092_c0_g1_i4.p1 TRINITY_DN4092_c0_g1~~TRINITY_DN4092_c0_g1_i4.p1  ORF type:complete len:554 (-),score=65.02 TRINITY_DN4092_c0_g1_i4:85-1746(-)